MSEVRKFICIGQMDQRSRSGGGDWVALSDYDASQSDLAALREELAECKRDRDTEQRAAIEANGLLTAAEQRNAELELDKIRIDWLIEQPVDTLYLDDGRIIDIAGRVDLRDAIDEAMAKPAESGASE